MTTSLEQSNGLPILSSLLAFNLDIRRCSDFVMRKMVLRDLALVVILPGKKVGSSIINLILHDSS